MKYLEDLVIQKFNQIPNRNLKEPMFESLPTYPKDKR